MRAAAKRDERHLPSLQGDVDLYARALPQLCMGKRAGEGDVRPHLEFVRHILRCSGRA